MKLNHEEINAVLASLERLIAENEVKVQGLRQKEVQLKEEIRYYESLRDKFLNLPIREFV